MKCAYNRCNLEVANFDPERIQVGLDVFHQNCLRAKRREDQQTEQQRLNAHVVARRPKEQYYRRPVYDPIS